MADVLKFVPRTVDHVQIDEEIEDRERAKQMKTLARRVIADLDVDRLVSGAVALAESKE